MHRQRSSRDCPGFMGSALHMTRATMKMLCGMSVLTVINDGGFVVANATCGVRRRRFASFADNSLNIS